MDVVNVAFPLPEYENSTATAVEHDYANLKDCITCSDSSLQHFFVSRQLVINKIKNLESSRNRP